MKSTFRAIRSGLKRSQCWFQRSLPLASAKPKVRYVASSDEVTVIRDGECARIEYKEAGIPVTNLEIGPEIAAMSDSAIVQVHNQDLRNKAKQAAECKHVVYEVPLGSAQIEYFARCDQWIPKGSVLRCQIKLDEQGQIIIEIDERRLRLKQFGKLLASHQGWGMRIEFVHTDEVHHRPALQVRQPR
jgi:hypothetical protein